MMDCVVIKLEPWYKLHCEICCDSGDQGEAISFCSECEQHMCESHLLFHSSTSATRKHESMDKHSMPKFMTRPKIIDICRLICLRHRNEPIDYYCKLHNDVLCCSCYALEHKACDDVLKISKVVESETVPVCESVKWKLLMKQIIELEDEIRKAREKLEQKQIQIKEIKKKAKADVRKLKEEIIKTFEDLENKLEEDIEYLEEQDTERLEKMQDLCDASDFFLKKFPYRLIELKKEGDDKGLFTIMNKASREIQKIMDEFDSVDKETKPTEYQFEPTKKIQKFMGHVAMMGKLVSRGRLNTEVTAKHMDPIMARSSLDETTCWLTGSTVLPDGSLMVCDRANMNVKLIHPEKIEILSTLTLQSGPWGITTLPNNEVAVTQPESKIIHFLSVADGQIKDTGKTIEVKDPCYGIGHRKQTLIVGYARSAEMQKVEIMNMDGVVLKSLISEIRGPFYLDVSPDEHVIYISNYWKHTLACFRHADNTMKVTKDTAMKGTRGVAVDQYGNVFVACQVSKNVIMFAPNGSRVKTLLDEKEFKGGPFSLAYCHKTEKLYVTSYEEDKIDVFQLQWT